VVVDDLANPDFPFVDTLAILAYGIGHVGVIVMNIIALVPGPHDWIPRAARSRNVCG
jgi:hypothetical protein